MNNVIAPPMTFMVTPRVQIEGSRYVVELADGVVHTVQKDRSCSCGAYRCAAVHLVEEYLRRGGCRAPHQKCPVCGEEAVRDISVSTRHTIGWSCSAGGLEHFWEARANTVRPGLLARKWIFPPLPGYPGIPVSGADDARRISEESHARWAAEGYDPAA